MALWPELEDAVALEATIRKDVWVQLPPEPLTLVLCPQ